MTRQDASTGQIVEEEKSQVPEGMFHCRIYSPYKTYFEGMVTSISAVNDTGNFDILAKHHNFLTLLIPCEIVIRGILNAPADREEIIKISRAIMQVTPDEVIVFLDI
jgi:F0F1-type ATP synthase epsilon subunit